MQPATARQATTANLLIAMRRVVRYRDALMRDHAGLLGLVLDVGARALLGQVPVGHQLEEHRHEKDGQEGRRQHPAPPPRTRVPADRRAPAPAPVEKASGITPRMKASEVMRIGRKRSLAASTAAAEADSPCSCFITAYSTIRMACFAARPSSVTSPIWKYTSLVRPLNQTAASAPNVPNGIARSTESGSDHFSYCAARIRNTMTTARPSARPEVPAERFSW